MLTLLIVLAGTIARVPQSGGKGSRLCSAAKFRALSERAQAMSDQNRDNGWPYEKTPAKLANRNAMKSGRSDDLRFGVGSWYRTESSEPLSGEFSEPAFDLIDP
jgi:hypothetical protein